LTFFEGDKLLYEEVNIRHTHRFPRDPA